MEHKDGYVSIWVGHFHNEEDFFDYLEKSYEDDRPQSGFISDFDIDDYDEDFAEGEFIKEEYSILATIRGFSYGDSYAQAVEGDITRSNVNSVYAIYDVDGSRFFQRQGAPMYFLGVYPYVKS